jgi:hypothetical protein
MFKLRFTLTLVLITLFYGYINADTLDVASNKFTADWGTNYYGNTFLISVSRTLSKHFSVGLGYGQGTINFQIKGPSSFWGVDFGDFEELNTNIDFNHMIDFVLYYNIHRPKTFSLLNTYGLGLSHYNLTVSQSAYRTNIDYRYSGYYSGSKFISGYAFFTSIDFVEWHPNKDKQFSLIWGGKMHITAISMPQRNTLSNGYDITTISETSDDGKSRIIIFDPESSLRFNYFF